MLKMFDLMSNNENDFLHKDGLSIPLNKFAECRNSYSGSVFLLASGASVSEFPVSHYADFPFIAMNGSIVRLVAEKIRPLFYLCSDPSFPRDSPDVAALGCEHAHHVAMSLDTFSEFHAQNKTILSGKSLYLLERVNSYYNKKNISDRRFAWMIRKSSDFVSDFSLFRSKPNRIGFSKDMSLGYFCARTIVFIALQLAYTLGFQKIFIVGMDMNKEVGRFYDKSATSLPTSIDIDYHKYILPSFQIFSKKILKTQEKIKVYNLSMNSRLPGTVIPKITLDQLGQLLSAN
jgi:KDO transferase-3